MAETPEPSPGLADSREVLLGYLEHRAAAILRKLDGLSVAELRRSVLPSGWAPLEAGQAPGLRRIFAGGDVDFG